MVTASTPCLVGEARWPWVTYLLTGNSQSLLGRNHLGRHGRLKHDPGTSGNVYKRIGAITHWLSKL